ncbi:MAG: DUF167 domain-containing protein [Armatimonadetes bacterium]|nr:DUF167 domain-containing protein [Armatimonadota bacterium]
MELKNLKINRNKDGLTFEVFLKPSSSLNQIKIKEGILEIKVKAPPIEGKANEALKKVLAEYLKIKLSKIQIIKGLKSKNKIIKIISEPK